MKNCNEIRELLSFYLDNELHENDRKQVVKHLERCSDCKAQLEELKNIVELISDVEEVSLPQDFSAKLHEKLVKVNDEIKPVKKKIKINYFGWSAAFVAVFAIALVGINMGFFNQITDRNSKVAYVNNAELQTVSKDQIADINKSPTEIKGKDSNEASKANKSTEIKKGVAGTGTNNTVQSQNSTPTATPAPSAPNNVTTAGKTMAPTSTRQMSAVNYYTLSVSNTTDSTYQITNAIKNNGGQIQPNYMIAMDNSSGRNYTISVSKDSYNALLDSLSKIGTVESSSGTSRSTAGVEPPRAMGTFDTMSIQGASADKDAYSEGALQDESQNVTIELKVQQK